MDKLRLIDQFYQPWTYDAYTFVFDEQDPRTGYFTMLALSEDGAAFSQWTEGLYTKGAANEHLGRRVALGELGQALLAGVDARLAAAQEETPSSTAAAPREERA